MAPSLFSPTGLALFVVVVVVVVVVVSFLFCCFLVLFCFACGPEMLERELRTGRLQIFSLTLYQFCYTRHGCKPSALRQQSQGRFTGPQQQCAVSPSYTPHCPSRAVVSQPFNESVT